MRSSLDLGAARPGCSKLRIAAGSADRLERQTREKGVISLGERVYGSNAGEKVIDDGQQ